MTARSLLSVSSLNVSYGRLHVLKGISLHVSTGEIVTLLGANGAGKTTTLRALSGLLRPDSGALTLEGQSLLGLSPEKVVTLGVTQAPEGRQIFGPLSVQDNLLLGAYTRLRAGQKDEVQQDLGHMYELFPVLRERHTQRGGSLSGGQQQMLAIARALMARPRLLLLDEPCLGLAPLVARQIMQTVAALRDQGVTVLLVEQNAQAALAIADRGYVMETGKIVIQGTAKELLQNREVRRAYLGKDYEEV